MISEGGVEQEMEANQMRTTQRILPLLREVLAMLVEPPASERSKLPARTGVSLERTAQVAGLQALIMPMAVTPLLLLSKPTGPIGEAGWFLALGLIAVVIAIGFGLIRAHDVSAGTLARINAFVAAVLATLGWLTGGIGSPFPILFPLLASSITPHRPRVRRVLIGWLLFCVAIPLAYEDAVTAREVGEVLMIGAASVATLLTMVWLSTRVGRSEAGLMDQVTSAEVAREALEAETDRLQEINQERDRLVTRISHELRTPLTSVKGYVEALIEGEGGELDPTQRELAAVALRNTVRLELLISDLLLLSRVEAGQLELRAKKVEVASLLNLLSGDMRQLANERSIRLIVEVPTGLAWTLDKERVEQAVANLVSNAIKYSPEGKQVLIRAREAAGELVIEVVDKGVGIPADEIDRIGHRFFRASTAGDTPGTGLGISIARELVALHGGRLTIESQVDSGSIFRIRLPRNPGRRSITETERQAD